MDFRAAKPDEKIQVSGESRFHRVPEQRDHKESKKTVSRDCHWPVTQ
jgi:hypothetical protein